MDQFQCMQFNHVNYISAGNCVQWSNCPAGLVCYLPQDGDIRQKSRSENRNYCCHEVFNSPHRRFCL